VAIAYGDITGRKQVDAWLRIEHDLALALSNTSRLKDGLRLCLEAVFNISGLECGGFYLVDKTTGALDLAFHQGLSSDFVKAVAQYAADSAHAKLVMAGQSVFTKYLALGCPLSEAERREGLHAVAVVPVSHEGQVIGCLNVASHTLGEVPAFARDALETVVAQTGNAIARLQAEDALHHQTEVQQTIFDNLPVMIAFLDREGRHQLVNRCWQSTLGWSLEEARHKDVLAELYPDLVYQKFVRDCIAASAETWGDFKTRTRDGRVLDTSWVNVPFPDGSNIGIGIDITARKRKEEELELKNEELIRFAYAVSHDLKSPVVTIRTFLGYLEQDIQDQDAARVAKDLDYIRTAADKMSHLLDELLELSRVGHKVNPSVEAPLQAIVDEALALVAGRITQRGVQVQVTEEPIRLYGDRPRLVQVFQNLVENAVKFMGDQPAPRMEIGVEQARDEIVLFVRDNGLGIDPRYQPKLFGVFEKLDPGTEGTGIGLALVQRIVEVHGGRIWVESEGLGKGAAFCFTLGKAVRSGAWGEGCSVGIVRSGNAKKNNE
jgi:PAS domain S-box-containing protein